MESNLGSGGPLVRYVSFSKRSYETFEVEYMYNIVFV